MAYNLGCSNKFGTTLQSILGHFERVCTIFEPIFIHFLTTFLPILILLCFYFFNIMRAHLTHPAHVHNFKAQMILFWSF